MELVVVCPSTCGGKGLLTHFLMKHLAGLFFLTGLRPVLPFGQCVFLTGLRPVLPLGQCPPGRVTKRQYDAYPREASRAKWEYIDTF